MQKGVSICRQRRLHLLSSKPPPSCNSDQKHSIIEAENIQENEVREGKKIETETRFFLKAS
jgi:hypothetical protein